MAVYLSGLLGGRLRPAQVRATRFGRTRVGRRGLAENQVYAFVRRMADELTARDVTEAGLRDENARLKQALREWQTRHSRAKRDGVQRWTDPDQHS
jgi:DivIVA domain-containing protein